MVSSSTHEGGLFLHMGLGDAIVSTTLANVSCKSDDAFNERYSMLIMLNSTNSLTSTKQVPESRICSRRNRFSSSFVSSVPTIRMVGLAICNELKRSSICWIVNCLTF